MTLTFEEIFQALSRATPGERASLFRLLTENTNVVLATSASSVAASPQELSRQNHPWIASHMTMEQWFTNYLEPIYILSQQERLDWIQETHANILERLAPRERANHIRQYERLQTDITRRRLELENMQSQPKNYSVQLLKSAEDEYNKCINKNIEFLSKCHYFLDHKRFK